MSASLDRAHDAAVTSWVASANDPAVDFPIQNLPFGRFRSAGQSDWRIGVAIGDQVRPLGSLRLKGYSDVLKGYSDVLRT